MPTQVRSEGIAERLGDIILQCSGSTPGVVLSGNLSIFLPISITNRVDTSNRTTDASVSVDFGGGFVPSGIPGTVNIGNIAFNGISITVPSSGAFNVRISNIRGNAAQAGPSNIQPIRAQITFSSTASPLLNQSLVIVAYPQTGLLSLVYDRGVITCVGSPVPSTVNLANLFNTGTSFSSIRLTEGFAAAFTPRAAGEDNGTRFLINYSGFPAGTHLYLPDFVAGSDAAVPTSGGDLGVPRAVGQYVPGSNSLLLARVQFTDSNGAGNVTGPPSGIGPIALNSVSEVPLTSGSGFAVYEVVDSNPGLQESAQIPTFVGLSNVTAAAVAQASVSFAPVSTAFTASTSAPIPRFVAFPPSPDCTAVGDCGASYFPKLSVDINPVQLTAVAGGAMTSQPGYVPIQNGGGGLMPWTATLVYLKGSGWLTLDKTSGVNNASIRLFASGNGLTPGTYQASLVITTGTTAGSATIPITLTVTAAPVPPAPPAPPAPPVTVSRVVNAATFEATPLVAGSLGTIMGANLSGKSVSVTFDGTPATLLYVGSGQINLQVPAGLGAKTTASLVVTVDGNSSTPQQVTLSPAWPTVFANGVLNQDNSVNAATAAGRAGTVLQIFATGIPTGATVTAQIADRKGLVPLYAGDAPDVPGVQQVNVAIPADLQGSLTQLIVCATAGGQQFCSPAYPLTVQ